MSQPLSRSLVVAAILAVGAQPVRAQGIPFSQRAAVQQVVAFTHITIAYGRPTARGRQVFGDSGVVKWNAVWHPGADSATLVTFDHDVLLEGKPLAAGEYTLWTIPRERGTWTVIVSRAAHVFHTPYPGEASDVMRFEIAPEQGAHMESLAYYFPAVLRDEATLRLHWGTVMIPLRLKAPFRPAS